MNMPTISIVIPTKDEKYHLPLLLESIREQSMQPEEIIVADAGSTDNTRQIAEEYGCVVVEGGMPGVGRNRGAEQVTSDLILFLDADMQMSHKDFLRDIVVEFEERGLDIAGADVLAITDLWYDKLMHTLYNVYVRLMRPFNAHVSGFFILVRRSLHEKIHGFQEDIVFAEDQDYANRAKKVGKYGLLNSVKIPISTRRLERDGRLRTAWIYILGEIHSIFIGPVKDPNFYTFGHDNDEKYARKYRNK